MGQLHPIPHRRLVLAKGWAYICCHLRKGELMKLKWFAIVLMLFPLCQAWAQEPAAAAGPAAATPETGLQSQKEKVSYGIGVEAGRNFKRNELDIDLELVIKGLKD